MKTFAFSLLFWGLFLSSTSNSALRRESCDGGLKRQTSRTLSGVDPDPFRQWLIWEQTANIDQFVQPTNAVAFLTTNVPVSQVGIWMAEGVSPDIVGFYVQNDHVRWIKHYANTNPKVPFFDRPPDPEPLMAQLTSSRSFVPVELSGTSVKVPTDHPHGPKGELQTVKLHTHEDIRAAILRSQHIQKVDKKLGPDPSLLVMMDVMAIFERTSGDGLLIRDISLLKDGNYYLPALSLPYVGRDLAELNGVSFEEFGREAYAKPLGRAKARLLLRYALEMVTPNAQNILIPLSKDLRSTGRIVLRDIPDTHYIEPLARAVGYGSAVDADKKMGLETMGLTLPKKLNPFWTNSRWLFDAAPPSLRIPLETLEDWGRAHDAAYIEEIESSLGVKIPKGSKSLDFVADFIFAKPAGPVHRVYSFLISPEGSRALKEYYSKLGGMHGG